MLTASDLRERLPALRRHAFLLTGARMAADAVVAIAIATLPRTGDGGSPQAADEGHLLRALGEAARRVVCPADRRLGPLHARLLMLPFLERQVLVLNAVERRDAGTIAAACNCAEPAVRVLLVRAHANLAAAGTAVAARPPWRDGRDGGCSAPAPAFRKSTEDNRKTWEGEAPTKGLPLEARPGITTARPPFMS